jgi:hypothetical protein
VTLWHRIYSERRRVLLPVFVLLAINLAALLLGVLPLMRGVGTAADEAVDASAELAAARKYDKDVKALRDGKERAAVETTKFYEEILPGSFAEAMQVTNFWLQGVANDAGVKFRTGQWEPEEVRDSRLIRLTGAATLSGDYSDIRKFLYHVETAEQFVVIEAVELAQANLVNQTASEIEVSLTIATYYLNPATEARAR